MIHFVLGFAIVWCMPIGLNLFTQFDGGFYYLAWVFGLTPALFAWLMAWFIQLRSPRIFLMSGRGMPALIRGLLAGGISLVLTAGGIVVIRGPDFPDILILVLSSSVATCLIVLLSPRIRAGLCARCRYDIRASLEFGRCPECGLTI